MIRVSQRRRKTQSGQEIFEFAAVAFLLVPMLMGGFVTGMGLIRSIEVNQACRDMANIYIHGGDFSTYPLQQLGQRLAQGLNMQIGPSFNGNDRLNTDNGGDAVVRVSQVMYIGPTTAATCQGVGAANCVNHDSFVFTERISFGNGGLSDPNTLGDPTTNAISSSGQVANPATDAGAKLPSSGQSSMSALWLQSGNGRTPITDGQIVYVVEMYVQSPLLSVGNLGGGAQYARYFF
jgi:hypothetical protein